MRPLRFMIFIATFLAIASSAWSGTRVKETWRASWAGGKCTLVLKYDLDLLQGSAKPRGFCAKLMKGVKSLVYTDETRSQMMMFGRPGAQGPLLGAFDKTGTNNMAGTFGDGESVSLFKSSSSSFGINVGTGAISGTGTAIPVAPVEGGCVRYKDSRGCVIAQDKKDPKIPAFQTIRLRALGDQSIFPFSGGQGIAKDESVAGGSCVVVKRCEKAFNSNEHWCEIVLSDGFFTGWVKRQDDDWVYLRHGC